MTKKEVQVGAVYTMKVGGRIANVKIIRIEEHAGIRYNTAVGVRRGTKATTTWVGLTLDTKREVTIRSATKLRSLVAAAS